MKARRLSPAVGVALFLLIGQQAAGASLPLKRVFLYKNGMAYLERAGTLSGPLTLLFHPRDMQDVLKSFSAWNPKTGDLYPVGYTTGIPLSQILGRFPFRIPGQGGMGTFLEQVQGARLELRLAGRKVEGSLLSVGAQPHAVDRQTTVPDHRLSLLTSSGIESFWLSEVQGLRFTNRELERQLAGYLEVVSRGSRQTRRHVTIEPGPAPGPVRVAYLEQFPVWKSSYRLHLEGNKSALEAWAQVDNPTGERWEGVELTLISGMPVSFLMDIYQPLYTSRTRVPLPGAVVAAPRQYEAAVETKGAVHDKISKQARAARPEKGRNERRLFALTEKGVGEFGAEGSVAAPRVASVPGAQVGEYYEYRIPQAVHLAGGESALLPLFKKPVAAEAVSIFSASMDRTHPRSGVWLSNKTGIPLGAGPLTVFLKGRYAGEALLAHLSPGERRLLSYGVDPDVEVARHASSTPETSVRVSVERGSALLLRESVATTRYQFRNKAHESRVLILEHPRNSDRKLKGKAFESSRNTYRFRIPLQPGQQVDFPVRETVSREVTLALGKLTRQQLEVYFSGSSVPARLRQPLHQILELRERIAERQGQLDQARSRRQALARDQERIRQNLRSLGTSTGEARLRDRYIRKLESQEDELALLKARQAMLDKQIRAFQADLSALIAGLRGSFDLG